VRDYPFPPASGISPYGTDAEVPAPRRPLLAIADEVIE
jgi:hypothetical protein